ncbi:MAG TPA: tetratricopeptide repeat protein [Candidatus Acidoferrum sp.]|jgi:tetratricopeptide (TPR) repeat protein|nr:tetratricopeptide repeat protein [Candidatus Acidoferrum sp.]
MRRWVYLCLLLGVSGAVWAQQGSAQTPPPAASSSENPDSAAGLSRDKTFPGDRPGNALPAKADTAKRAPSMSPPRSDRVQAEDLGTSVGESSSKDTQVDLSPPPDDAKAHPHSSVAVADAEAEVLGGGVSEFHTWDPHKAAKSVEVGDFYFKRKNYRAAEDRYREALRYKDNDAMATFRLAVCLEKLRILDDARAEYESYLKILPHGPEAMEAQKAIDRLKAQTAGTKQPQ